MGDLVRASDAERDAVVERLNRAAAEGRLDPLELDRRLDAALGARYREDLVPLTADLPAASTSPAAATPVTVEEQTSVFGDLRIAGAFRVPEHLRWRSTFGDVTLDLRRATLAGARTDLEVVVWCGDLTLVVADGTRVEVRCRTALGGIKQRCAADTDEDAPLVVLGGRAVLGDVRVWDHTAYEDRWSRRLGRRLRGS